MRDIRVNPRPGEGEPIVAATCVEDDCGWWLTVPSPPPADLQQWFGTRIAAHVRDAVGDGSDVPHRVDVRRAKTERWIAS